VPVVRRPAVAVLEGVRREQAERWLTQGRLLEEISLSRRMVNRRFTTLAAEHF
jgi:hypothetical protein